MFTKIRKLFANSNPQSTINMKTLAIFIIVITIVILVLIL